MSKFVEKLMRKGYLQTDSVIDAFSKIDRAEFVPDDLTDAALADIPVPIGSGQTVTAPSTVAIMLELLSADEGQNVLHVGTGSGWTTALLAYIVGNSGKVVSIERIKEVYDFARNNLEKYGFIKKGIVELYEQDGSGGFPKYAPYDRIIVSARTEEVPVELKKQLKIGGIMVIPVHNMVWYLQKEDEDDFYKEEYRGFSFVPLIQKSLR